MPGKTDTGGDLKEHRSNRRMETPAQSPLYQQGRGKGDLVPLGPIFRGAVVVDYYNLANRGRQEY